MDSIAGSALGKFLNSAGSSKKKPRWLNPEESTGELFRGINLGRKFCWEAVGPARETFTTLAAEIKAYLDSQSEPISSPVTWTMYMIGPTPESSRPTVMFCGADKSSRKLIKETIDNSGLLDKYPGIETGGCSQEFRLLATEDAMEHTTPTLSPVEKSILYSPRSAGPGMRIFIRGYDGESPNLRKARCGALLYHQDKCFLQTVAHAFEKIESPQIPKENETDNNEFQFELEDHDESDADEPDVSITGRGSATPDYHPYADHSSEDMDMEGSSDEEASPILTNLPGNLHLGGYNQVESKTKKIAANPKPSALSPTSLSMLGKAVISSPTRQTTDLDYCLIEIEKSQVSAVEEAFRNTSIARIVGSDKISLAARVLAFAGRSKPLEGKLSGTPTFLMLPGSRSTRELWAVRDLDSIEDGDCGSWVVDSLTGDLYGHIVASSVKSGLTYIIPAKSVFDDIQSRFNGEWSMTKPRSRCVSRFGVSSGAHFHVERKNSTQQPSKSRWPTFSDANESHRIRDINALSGTRKQMSGYFFRADQYQSQNEAREWLNLNSSDVYAESSYMLSLKLASAPFCPSDGTVSEAGSDEDFDNSTGVSIFDENRYIPDTLPTVSETPEIKHQAKCKNLSTIPNQLDHSTSRTIYDLDKQQLRSPSCFQKGGQLHDTQMSSRIANPILNQSRKRKR